MRASFLSLIFAFLLTSVLSLALLLALPLSSSLHAEEEGPAIDAAKDAAIERYMELNHSEEAFKLGLKAGLAAGFDPENNPALKAIPEDKLEKIVIAVENLFEDKFQFAAVKDGIKAEIHSNYTLDELKALNEVLATPIMQDFIKKNNDSIENMMKVGQSAMRPLQGDIITAVQRVMAQP